jgi:N-acetylglucosaminyl-diphospho-decaprenol L-rhamnosyltransferase
VPIGSETARITAVIVNYQSYDELRNCLESLDRACDRISVVVVDHASVSGTADELGRTFPEIRLLRLPDNHGFAAGINRGARETDSPFLLLLNPDCVVEPDTCCRLAACMEDHDGVGVVGPRIRNADGSVQQSARRFPDFTTAIAGRSSWLTRVAPNNPLSRHNLPVQGSLSAARREVDWVSGACMLVRRAAFDAVSGMDEGFFLYWEDADFCQRLKHAGFRTMYCPEAVATHVGGRSSRHAADASLEAFHRSALRLYSKHAGPVGRLLTPLVFIGLRIRLAFMKRLVRMRKSS